MTSAFKILQARLQQYVNCEIPDVQAGFKKGRGTRDQIAYIHWINKKQKSFTKEIEEKKTMGKTRDLFKKIRDIKGIFHAKMGSIKDRNGLDITEGEDIKKRWH